MDFILDKMMHFLNEDKIMDREKEEIIRYGLELFFLKLIFVFAVTGTGIVLGCVWEGVLFLFLFIPIRSMAGGYHAKTRMGCFLLSVLSVIIVLELLKVMIRNTALAVVIMILSVIFCPIIWYLSPVENKNKKISEEEKVSIRKKMRIYILAEGFITGLAFCLGYYTAFYLMGMAILVTGLLVVTEYIRDRLTFRDS